MKRSRPPNNGGPPAKKDCGGHGGAAAAADDDKGVTVGYLAVVFEPAAGWTCEFSEKVTVQDFTGTKLESEERKRLLQLVLDDGEGCPGYLLAAVEKGADEYDAAETVDRWLMKNLSVKVLESMTVEMVEMMIDGYDSLVREDRRYKFARRRGANPRPAVTLPAKEARSRMDEMCRPDYYEHYFKSLSAEQNPWRNASQRENARLILGEARELSDLGRHEDAVQHLVDFQKLNYENKAAYYDNLREGNNVAEEEEGGGENGTGDDDDDPLANTCPKSPLLASGAKNPLANLQNYLFKTRPAAHEDTAGTGGLRVEDTGLPAVTRRQEDKLPEDDADVFLPPGAPSSPEDNLCEANVDDVVWDAQTLEKVGRNGSTKKIRQLKRDGLEMARPVHFANVENLEKELEEREAELSEEERGVDRLNSLRYRILTRKLDLMLALTAANSEALEKLETNPGGKRKSRQNQTKILSTKARALMAKLQMPFTSVYAVDDAFESASNIALAEELVEEMRTGDVGPEFWSYFTMIMMAEQMQGRTYHCAANGAKSKQDGKIHTSALGIGFCKLTNKYMKFVMAFVMRSDGYRRLPEKSEERRLYLEKVDTAVKNKFGHQREARAKNRRRLCIERVLQRQENWQVSLYYLLDDQLFKNTLLHKVIWPKGDEAIQRFLARYRSTVEVKVWEMIRPKLGQTSARCFADVGVETLLQLSLEDDLRRKYVPTDDDNLLAQQSAALKSAKKQKKKKSKASAEEITEPNILGREAEVEEEGGAQPASRSGWEEEELEIANSQDSQDSQLSQSSRKSGRLRRTTKRYQDGFKGPLPRAEKV